MPASISDIAGHFGRLRTGIPLLHPVKVFSSYP